MKKLLFLLIATLLLTGYSFAKPFYIGFRMGFFAKWQIVFDECEDGKGICLIPGSSNNPDNAQLGYDAATADIFYLKISVKNTPMKLGPGENFVLQEDSPINPKLIKKFESFKNPDNKLVYLKKGTYPVRVEGDSYVIVFKYFIQ